MSDSFFSESDDAAHGRPASGGSSDDFLSFSDSDAEGAAAVSGSHDPAAAALAARLKAMHAAAEATLAESLQAQLETALADAAAARADAVAAAAAAAAARADADALRARLDEVEASQDSGEALAATQARIEALTANVAKLKADAADAARNERMVKSNTHATISALEKKHALAASKWEAERAKLESELLEANTSCNALSDDLARATSHAEIVEADLNAAKAEIADLVAQLDAADNAAAPDSGPDDAEAAADTPTADVPLAKVANLLSDLNVLSSESDSDGDVEPHVSQPDTPSRPRRANEPLPEEPAVLDPETKHQLADKLADVEASIAKQLKVIDGVSMVRSSFPKGTESRSRADEQYTSLVWDLEALETQRNILETQLKLPVTPKIILGKRKKKRRARSDTILRKISRRPATAEGPKFALLDELDSDALTERLRKVTKSLKSKREEKAALHTFLKPDSPFKYESGSAPHTNLVQQIAEADDEIAALSELHAEIVSRLGLTEADVDELELKHELDDIRSAIDKQLATRESLAAQASASAASDSRAAQALAREDELCSSLGLANERAPRYDPSAYTDVLVAVYEYKARNSSELSFSDGDRLGLLEDYNDGWSMCVKLETNETGLVPSAYAEPENE
ncbi:uncharacterized protein AMSG_07910 [Thecamonas trahens ATCC 50062]|uniref:SH3 domain-containing protein n=1 Tax=Thecamonas trahens ATCC 50062 TaxID=461836 RepID=A0A0L0DHN6_THETB|nr:hypothetical protein AMSG_07910 [Thecamonas trahens ATCC 50062]KNC51827.1 hypothetical protein AMSG_07910 [Thecamonas trahens ATCC 50062]|eukprot:XP_013755692.1 hypothetical protein AMSG_07910 [Thecamonas trahens ATCC 50062]